MQQKWFSHSRFWRPDSLRCQEVLWQAGSYILTGLRNAKIVAGITIELCSLCRNYIPRLKKVRRTSKADKSSGIEMSRMQML